MPITTDYLLKILGLIVIISDIQACLVPCASVSPFTESKVGLYKMLWTWHKTGMKQYHSTLVSRETLQLGRLHQRHGTSQQVEQTLCRLDLSWHPAPSMELQVLCSPALVQLPAGCSAWGIAQAVGNTVLLSRWVL